MLVATQILLHSKEVRIQLYEIMQFWPKGVRTDIAFFCKQIRWSKSFSSNIKDYSLVFFNEKVNRKSYVYRLKIKIKKQILLSFLERCQTSFVNRNRDSRNRYGFCYSLVLSFLFFFFFWSSSASSHRKKHTPQYPFYKYIRSCRVYQALATSDKNNNITGLPLASRM